MSDYEAEKKRFDMIENRCVSGSRALVTLDWFQVFGTIPLTVFQSESATKDSSGKTILELDHEVTLVLTNAKKTRRYHKLWEVYWQGEQVATLQTEPLNIMGPWDAESVALQMLNHTLYTSYWVQAYVDIAEATGFRFRTITRMDIAIDGLPGVIDFVNAYQRQRPDCSVIDKVCKTSKINAFKFKDREKEYDSFTIGSSKSHKVLSIYNKSKELLDSKKVYIPMAWEKCGVDKSQDVYRYEIRLDSEILKLYDIGPDDLASPSFLASLAMNESKKFAEFAWVNKAQKNTTRWKRVHLVNWDSLGAVPLDKAKMPETDGLYLVKMEVHNVFNDLFLSKVPKDQVAGHEARIDSLLDRFMLHAWYQRRQEFWAIDLVGKKQALIRLAEMKARGKGDNH